MVFKRQRNKVGIRSLLLIALSLQLCGCGALLIGAVGGAGGVLWVKGKTTGRDRQTSYSGT